MLDVAAISIIHLLDPHGLLVGLLETFVTAEIDACAHASTLFRGNTMTTKLLTCYGKTKGMMYLRRTLEMPVNMMLQMKSYELEVDPSRLQPEHDAEGNVSRLCSCIEVFVDQIVRSLPEMPLEFSAICRHLHAETERKFPGQGLIAIGGFLFLRLLCPAIVAADVPGTHRLAGLSSEERRMLVLCSKILQNISNNTVNIAKESWMIALAPSLQPLVPRVHDFFQQLLHRTATTGAPSSQQPQVIVSDNAVLDMCPLLETHLTKIGTLLLSDAPTDRSPALASGASHRGWVSLRTGGAGSYKRRWIVLKENVLYLFKTERQPTPTTVIPLEGASIKSFIDAGTRSFPSGLGGMDVAVFS